MIKDITIRIKNTFQYGHERTVRIKKNIFSSFLIKGISIVIGMIMVPMTINYVNPTQYGIWLTLSSMINWFNFFDIGLGNGLRNRLAASNADGIHAYTRTYVSTTYTILTIIAVFILSVLFFVNPHVNWQQILKINISSQSIQQIIFIAAGFFCIQFVVQIVNVVLIANHEPAKVSLINLIGQIFSLVVLFILSQNSEGSLKNLVFVFAGIPPLVLLLASIWLYRSSYKNYSPDFKLIDLKYSKGLLKSGGAFFIIQVGVLILYQTDNIIITQLFGPKEVTTFNIPYKLFAVVTMFFSIIMTPFWSAYTDAYTKGDFEWMKSILKRLHKLWVLLSLCSIAVLIGSPLVFHFWIGDSLPIPYLVSAVLCVYTISYMWYAIHVYLLNGIGKIRLQLYMVIISAIVNIPLAVILGKQIGLAGVTLSNVIVFAIMGVLVSLQCKKILNKNAISFWNK